MSLYKMLKADMTSLDGLTTWTKNEWQTYPAGELKTGVHGAPWGFRCSNDPIWALQGVMNGALLCKVETAGDSLIPRQTRKGDQYVTDGDGAQMWRSMRITNLWSWPKAEVEGLCSEMSALTHGVWAATQSGRYAAQAAAWTTAMDAHLYDEAADIVKAVWEEMHHEYWHKADWSFGDRAIYAASLDLHFAKIKASPTVCGGGGGIVRLANMVQPYIPPGQSEPPASGNWEPGLLYVLFRLTQIGEL